MAAVELATGYVTLAVETRGIGGQIAKAFGGADAIAGKSGRSMGRTMAKSFDSAKPDMDTLRADVEHAQKRVTAQVETSSRKQEGAKRKVEIAQARLNEVTEKYGAGSSQALRAADQLAIAEQKLEAAGLEATSAHAKLSEELSTAKTALNQAAASGDDYGKKMGFMARVNARMADSLPEVAANMEKVGQNFRDTGESIYDTGAGMTKKFTAPVGIAVGAVAGLTAALGFGRLVGLDSAKAQLEGLGYSAKDVERITGQVTEAIAGGMTTMAEGTAIAAGALAAGVPEGKKLQKYIGLVGDAAVGANRPVEEMAQIFNRVQGGGKLMTRELNMIEMGLPGFAATMAKNLGVPQEEFRKMVTAGEISSEQFMEVMDDFAGGMADAQAKSWRGLVKNTKAYVGIIGEALLSGAFDKAKDSLGQFQEWLKSDDIQNWAAETGDKIGESFNKMVEAIQGAISWWVNLNPVVQKFLITMVALLVAIGPILMILGKLVAVIGTIISVVGVVTAGMAGFALASQGAAIGSAALTGATTAQTIAMNLAAIAAKALNFVLALNPFTLVALAVVAFIAVIVLLYKKTDWMKKLIDGAWIGIKTAILTAWDAIKIAFHAIIDFVSNKLALPFIWFYESVIKPVWGGIQNFIIKAGAKIKTGMKSVSSFVENTLAPIFKWLFEKIIKPVWTGIKTAIAIVVTAVLLYFESIKFVLTKVLAPAFLWLYNNAVKPAFNGIKKFIGGAWNVIKKIFQGITNFVKKTLGPVFTWLYKNLIKPIWDGISKYIKTSWAIIKIIFQAISKFLKGPLASGFKWFRDKLIKPIWNGIKSFISGTWNGIKKIFNGIVKFLKGPLASGFRWLKDKLIVPIWNGIKSFISGTWNGIKKIFNSIINFVKGAFANAFRWLRDRLIKPIWDGISKTISYVWTKKIKPIFKALGDFIKKHVAPAFQKGVDAVKKAWEKIRKIAAKPIAFVVNTVIRDKLLGTYNKVAKKLKIPEITPPPEFKGYAAGGWTGPGHKYKPVNVVHADEFVVQKSSQRSIAQAAPGFLDSLNKYGAKALGYAKGGLVNPMPPAWRRVSAGWHGYPGHLGTDYPAPRGTVVRSPGKGTVSNVGTNLPGGTGKQVWINHTNGLLSRVHHLQKQLVKMGQSVNRGTPIGQVGLTGNTTGYHAHWGVMDGKRYINPATVWGSGKGGGGSFYNAGGAGGGGGFDLSRLNPLKALKDKLGGWFSKKFPKGGAMVDTAKAGAKKLITAAPKMALKLGEKAWGKLKDFGGNVASGIASKANKAQVRAAAAKYGWGTGPQFKALSNIISRESGWKTNAANPSSSARGLFQKMTSIHGDIEKTAFGQAKWGTKYIKGRFGDPINAWKYWQRNKHYSGGGLVTPGVFDQGGYAQPGDNLIRNLTKKPEPVLSGGQWSTMMKLADAAASYTSGGDTYIIEQVTIPVSDIKEIQDVTEFFKSLRRKTRQKVGSN